MPRYAVPGLAALVALAAGCGKPPPPMSPPDAPPVAVQRPKLTEYNPTKEFAGRLVTKDPVKVVPQVSGMIRERKFTEGATVEKDKTVLFTIDPTQYDADLRKAKADVARAEADIENAVAQVKLGEAELTRNKKAFDEKATGKTDLDKAVATLDVAKAQVNVAKASKDSAEAAVAKAVENLRYCTILAPNTGRAGMAKVSDKSIVDAYKTELVEIAPIDPIYAVWEVDELTSLWYRDQIYEKKAIPDPRNKETPLKCWVILRDGKTYPKGPDGGKSPDGQPVDYYDPEIVRGTGARTIRATFPNPNGLLSGGDSVQVLVSAGAPRQVLTVPETAVFAQQRKRYVYVADGDEAKLREVQPGPTFDGRTVIEGGLTTADRVIVDNLLRVRPGAKVKALE